MVLAMFRKRVGSDRTVDRNVSQSWRARSWRTSQTEMNMLAADDDNNGVRNN